MGNFNKSNKMRETNNIGKHINSDETPRRFNGKSSDKPRTSSFRAVCSNCRKNCEVPFKPTNQKPVFCSDCFRNKNKQDFNLGGGSRNDFKHHEKRPSFNDSKITNYNSAKSEINYKVQFDQLNAKLDRILKALNPVIVDEDGMLITPKSKKFVKAPKKPVDTAMLKNMIDKTVEVDVNIDDGVKKTKNENKNKNGIKKPKKSTAKKLTKTAKNKVSKKQKK